MRAIILRIFKNTNSHKRLKISAGRRRMAILGKSAITVPRTATVMETVRTMAGAKVGSVVVLDGDRLAGIFTERDVMLRVVLEGRDPERTKVEEVMTSTVQTIPAGTTGDEALVIMHQNYIRHLPVVDDQGRVQAIVSMRDLLEEKVQDLNQQLDSLESYFSADGIGG
jgi:CBS domain-containing protein